MPEGKRIEPLTWDLYWELITSFIDRATVPEKRLVTDKSPYTPETAQEAKNQVWLLLTKVKRGEASRMQLPQYMEISKDWEQNRQDIIKQMGTMIGEEYIEFGDKYYTSKNFMEVSPSLVQRYMGKLYGEGELTAYQKEQLKRADIKTAYEVTQEANKQERERQKEERDVWIRSTQAQYAPYIMQAERLAQEQDRWLRGESARDQMLSRLSDPRSPTFHKDWVARWQVMYGARNYPTPAPLQTKAYQAQLNINQAKERTLQSAELLKQGVISSQQYEGQVQDYFTTVSEGQPWIAQQQQSLAESNPVTGQGMLGTAGRYWGAEKGGESLSDVGNPPVPAWLSKFAPGQKRTISRENIPTPSAQLWARTSPSEKQALEGYLDWVNEEAMNGRTMEDILWEMNRMRTGTPSRQAWLPARQRF